PLRSDRRVQTQEFRRRWCKAISTLEDPRSMAPENLDHQPCIAEFAKVTRRSVNGRDRNIDGREPGSCGADDEIRLVLVPITDGVNLSQHLGLEGAIAGLAVADLATRDSASRRR